MRVYWRGLGVPWGAWTWLAMGSLIYGLVVAMLLVLDLGTAAPADPLVPSWAPLLLTPVLYAVLALTALTRVSLIGTLVATCAMCVLRVLLGALSAVLAMVFALSSFTEAFVDAFSGVSMLTLLGLASPPLLLAPLRRVRPRHRWVPADARLAERASPVRGRPAERGEIEQPAGPSVERGSGPAVVRARTERRPAAPVARPVSEPSGAPLERGPAASRPASAVPAGSPTPEPMVSPEMTAPSVSPGPAAARAAVPTIPPPIPTPSRESVPAAAVPPPVRPTRGSEPVEDVVRISFARVAGQLPAETFHLPPDRVAANLLDAEHLLVPMRLVAPQLVEGLVQVPWSAVAEQFPRQTLALPDSEIAKRLPNGALVLPLDEVIRQMPTELFALSSPALDVRGIEDFPSPFQPHVPQSSAGEAEPPATPLPARVTTAESAPAAPPSVKPTPLREPPEPAPARLAAPTAGPARPASAPTSVAAAPATAAPTAPGPRALSLASGHSSASHAAALQRLGALMRWLRAPLEVGVREEDGVTLFTVVPVGLSEDAIAATVVRMLPCLEVRLPEALKQVTLRSSEMVVVLTPLAGRPPYDAVIAAALPAGAPLALLEQQALRAATSLGRVGPSTRTAEPSPATRIDLRDAPIPVHMRAVAASLRAFGPLIPTVLQDAVGGTRLLYMFLPPGMDARALAELVSRLHAALSGGPIGPVVSTILRLGGHRVVVRTLAGDGSGSLLVAAGSGERPGLARLEVERAASRLASHRA